MNPYITYTSFLIFIIVLVGLIDIHINTPEFYLRWRIKHALKRKLKGFKEITQNDFFEIPKKSGARVQISSQPEKLLFFSCQQNFSFCKMVLLIKSILKKGGFKIRTEIYHITNCTDGFIATKRGKSFSVGLMGPPDDKKEKSFMIRINSI